MAAPAHLAFVLSRSKRIHLGISGSVAAIKMPELLRLWQSAGVAVSVTLTPAAQEFVGSLTFASLGAYPLYTGDGQSVHTTHLTASSQYSHDDVFAHLEPGHGADAFFIAPASASTIARLAHGMADSLLACQALAFKGPLIIAPAMNPAMWNNTATQENIALLQRRGHVFIDPAYGKMACNDEGQGRLASVESLYMHGLKAVFPQDLAGKKAMLTVGATKEPWDGVRYWTNPSTGIMGMSLACALWLRGAEVHVIGNALPWCPEDITIHPATTAKQMFEAAEGLFPQMDIGIFTAAVADYSPQQWGAEKFKKEQNQDGLQIDFATNKDILKTLGTAKKEHQIVIGFAAETQNIEASLVQKCQQKNADLMVGNLVNQAGSGFGTATNQVYVVQKDALGQQNPVDQWPMLSKAEVALRIVEWLVPRLH